jgi:hypothetical protein
VSQRPLEQFTVLELVTEKVFDNIELSGDRLVRAMAARSCSKD